MKYPSQIEPIMISSEMITDYKQLKPGDHIAVPGHKAAGIQVFHQGIYLGLQVKTGTLLVADVPGIQGPRAITLERFTYGGVKEITRFIYKSGSLSRKEVLLTTCKYVKHPYEWEEFDYTKNNCEHFATLCKTGKPFSLQVDKQLKFGLKHPFRMLYWGFTLLSKNLRRESNKK